MYPFENKKKEKPNKLNKGEKMTGKIEFGVDFLYLCRDFISRSANPNEEVDEIDRAISDVAARLFLLLWGLSVDEGDEANQKFWERVNNNSLEDLDLVVERIVKHLEADRSAQERLIVQLTAIGLMDFDVTEGEKFVVNYLSDKFDFRPSELSDLADQGHSLAVGLNYFGDIYMQEKTKRQ